MVCKKTFKELLYFENGKTDMLNLSLILLMVCKKTFKKIIIFRKPENGYAQLKFQQTI